MLGENIKRLRKDAGMTQADLASKLGVSTITVTMWETNKRKPKIDTLDTISGIFGVGIADLVDGNDPYAKMETEAVWMDEGEIDSFCEEIQEYAQTLAGLDEYGQKAVRSLIRVEKERCIAQETFVEGAYRVQVRTGIEK